LSKWKADCAGSFSKEEAEAMISYLVVIIQSVGKRLDWRQPVIATAIVFFRRFFVRSSLAKFDPRLVVPTCLYIAGKVEEMGQIKVEKVLNQFEKVTLNNGRKVAPLYFPKYTPSQVHDYEFYILNELSCDLVVFHPYRSLVSFIEDAQLDNSLLQTSWNVVNDAYRTDVPLLFPPYIVSLGAIYIACVYQEIDVRKWYEKMNVNLDEIKQVVKYIMDLYADHSAPDAQKKKVEKIKLLEPKLVTYDKKPEPSVK